MFYPALFTPADEGGYVVTFPDIPEAVTQGDTLEEAMDMAEDVLLSSIEMYFDAEERFPLSRNAENKETAVFLPDSVYAKVLLNNAILEKSVSKAQLARLANIRPPEVQRILDPYHTTKIDTISNALSAIGKRLQLSLA